MIAKLINYFFATVGTLIVFQLSGVNISSLAVVAGGLGVGIGFGLQGITRDFKLRRIYIALIAFS